MATHRRIVVKNPDGTTKIIHQNISGTSTPRTPGEQTAQKVQIIRGPDGKVSVRGLTPGQQLIQMPDGKLHVLTSSSGQKAGNAVLNKPGTPKVITKLVNSAQGASTPGSPPAKVFIRQQLSKTPTAVGKQVIQKAVPQRVVVSGNQVISAPAHKVQVAANAQKIITSKGQILTPTSTQKVMQTSNLQQILTQGSPGAQKILINQSNSGNKVLIASSQSQTTTQANVVQSPPSTQQTQQIIVNQPGQKVVQQFVNSSNQQQQIIVGGQRILLNPGQRIITQQQQPAQVVQQVVQQPQIIQQVCKTPFFSFVH